MATDLPTNVPTRSNGGDLSSQSHSLRSDQPGKRTSHASDTSSAYSGSDMMQSSIDDQDIDLSGLVESMVDSDDEEGYVESSEVRGRGMKIMFYFFEVKHLGI